MYVELLGVCICIEILEIMKLVLHNNYSYSCMESTVHSCMKLKINNFDRNNLHNCSDVVNIRIYAHTYVYQIYMNNL